MDFFEEKTRFYYIQTSHFQSKCQTVYFSFSLLHCILLCLAHGAGAVFPADPLLFWLWWSIREVGKESISAGTLCCRGRTQLHSSLTGVGFKESAIRESTAQLSCLPIESAGARWPLRSPLQQFVAMYSIPTIKIRPTPFTFVPLSSESQGWIILVCLPWLVVPSNCGRVKRRRLQGSKVPKLNVGLGQGWVPYQTWRRQWPASRIQTDSLNHSSHHIYQALITTEKKGLFSTTFYSPKKDKHITF